MWISAVCLLLIALALLVQTRFFKDRLRSWVEEQGERVFAADLRIGRIDGNPLRAITLLDVQLIKSGDTLLAIPQIDLAYSLSSLVEGRLLIGNAEVYSPAITVRHLQGSTWNFSDLINSKTQSGNDNAGRGSLPDYAFEIETLMIQDGAVRIQAPSPLIPREMSDLNLNMKMTYNRGTLDISVPGGQLNSYFDRLPPLAISFDARVDSQSILLDNILLASPRNTVSGRLQYRLGATPGGFMELAGEQVSLQEFSTLLPAVLHTSLKPDIRLAAELYGDSLMLDMNLTSKSQSVTTMLFLDGLSGFISDSCPVPHFLVQSHFEALEPDLWVAPAMPHTLLNGSFQIDGSGRNLQELVADGRMELHGGYLFDQPLQSGQATGTWDAMQLSFSALSKTEIGAVDLAGKIRWSHPIEYQISGDVVDFDVTSLFPELSRLDIRPVCVELEAVGQGLERQYARGELSLRSKTVRINDVVIDSASAKVTAFDGALSLDTLLVFGEELYMGARAEVSRTDSIGLTFEGNCANLALMQDLIPVSDMAGVGTMRGQAQGSITGATLGLQFELDSLSGSGYHAATATGELDLTTSGYSVTASALRADICNAGSTRLHVDSLTVRAEMSLADDTLEAGNASVTIVGAEAGGISLDSVTADVRYDHNRAKLDLRAVSPESLSALATAELHRDSVLTIILPRIEIDLGQHRIRSGNEVATITLMPDDYRVNNLVLESSSGSDDLPLRVTVNGTAGPDGDDTLSLVVTGVRLQELPQMAFDQLAPRGELSVDVVMTAVTGLPTIAGHFSVVAGALRDQSFEEFSGTIGYADNRLDIEGVLRSQDRELVAATGYLPITLSLPGVASLDTTGPMLLRVQADSIALRAASAFTGMLSDAEGYASCDLEVTRTPAWPLVSGMIAVRNGYLALPFLGTTLRDFQAEIQIDSNRITIEQWRAMGGKGTIEVSGEMSLPDSRTGIGQIGGEVKLKAAGFEAVNLPDLAASINADMSIRPDQPEVEGTVEIVNASLWLPAIASELKRELDSEVESLPLLVQATGVGMPLSATAVDNAPGRSRRILSELASRLRGHLRLRIGNDTWIRGRDVRMELTGDLEVVKDSSNLRIFGTVETRRGQLTLMGRRFNLTKGEVTFVGNARPDPTLNITAEHDFMGGNRTKHVMKLQISGTREEPEISFYVDNNSITESQAVSFIFFGRTPDELTSTQETGLGDLVAMGVASSLASAQLSQTIGEGLDLDYIELYASESWRRASLAVGKYLTDRWFVSYEREFTKEQAEDIAPAKVTAEYELTDKVSMRLLSGNSKERGVDLLIRFEGD